MSRRVWRTLDLQRRYHSAQMAHSIVDAARRGDDPFPFGYGPGSRVLLMTAQRGRPVDVQTFPFNRRAWTAVRQ
jgi:hypothetical protein